MTAVVTTLVTTGALDNYARNKCAGLKPALNTLVECVQTQNNQEPSLRWLGSIICTSENYENSPGAETMYKRICVSYTYQQALNKDTELPQTSVPIPNVPDEAVYQERGDSVERVATTATSLEAVQDSSNIAKTQSTATPTEPISQETGLDGGPRRQETIGGASVQTRFERASKLSYDSPLRGGNTPRSDEDSMTLQELTNLCIKLLDRVLALETDLRQTKKVYGTSYTKLIIKVKKLEKTVKTSQARRRAKIVVLDDDIASEDSSKQVSSQEDQPEDQLEVLSVAKVLTDAARVHTYSRRRRAVSTASRIVSTSDMIQQVNIIIPTSSATKDKEAIRLQEQLDEEESQRIARDAEGFTEDEWEDNRARVEVDEELTHKLQAEERYKYSKVDQARMLVDLINQRKRYVAA
ncbi:hypothetical protein Tco_0622790 [Tanacetum coccineum]